jgi:hypothetical protein
MINEQVAKIQRGYLPEATWSAKSMAFGAATPSLR